MPPLKGSPAELLLKKVHEKYLSLETYQDEGVLVRTKTFPDRKEEQRTEFRTLFKRPVLFRFEWSEEGSKSILFHFGGETLLVTGDEKVCHRFSDLNSGIAAATGISHGLVHDIPSHFSSDSIGTSTYLYLGLMLTIFPFLETTNGTPERIESSIAFC